jgi:hypothetical protein
MPWIHIDDLCGMYLQAILNPTMEVLIMQLF